jgi:hypothetical protein
MSNQIVKEKEQMYDVAKNIWGNEDLLRSRLMAVYETILKEGREEEDARLGYDTLERVAQDPDTNDYDVLVVTAATCLRGNQRLPSFLACFVADVLEGIKKRPTKRGADKYKNFERNSKIRYLADVLVKDFKLPKYMNNEFSETTTTAADIVSEVSGLSVATVINILKGR